MIRVPGPKFAGIAFLPPMRSKLMPEQPLSVSDFVIVWLRTGPSADVPGLLYLYKTDGRLPRK